MGKKKQINSIKIFPPDFDEVSRMSNLQLGLYIKSHPIKFPDFTRVLIAREKDVITVHYMNGNLEVFTATLMRFQFS